MPGGGNKWVSWAEEVEEREGKVTIWDIVRCQYPDLKSSPQKGVITSRDFGLQAPTFPKPDLTECVTVSEMAGKIHWKLMLPDEHADSSSITTHGKDIEVVWDHRNKIRHDLCAEALSEAKTDVPLKKLFKSLGNNEDNLSPDLAMVDSDGNAHIVEVSTTRSSERSSWSSESKNKIFKYEDPIRSRLRPSQIATLTVVLVCPRGVYSQLTLPQDMVDDLMFRFWVGVQIEDVAKDSNIDLCMDSQATVVERLAASIRSELSLIDYKDMKRPSALTIDQQWRDKCCAVGCSEDKLSSKEAFVESMKATFSELGDVNDSEKMVSQFRSKLIKKRNECRWDLKPVTTVPLLSLQRTVPTQIPSNCRVGGTGVPAHLKHVWGEAASALTRGDWRESDLPLLLKEAHETEKSAIQSLEEGRRKKMSSRHRVDMTIPLRCTDTRRALARDGVMAKREKDDPVHKVRLAQQKLPFSLNCGVRDITQWVNSTDWFEPVTILESGQESVLQPHDGLQNFEKLIKKALKLSDNPMESIDVVTQWASTHVGNSMLLLSDLGSELVLSMKQNCRKNEFILKKLRHFNLSVLMRTTNSDGHLFYSLNVPSRSSVYKVAKLPFRQVYKEDRGYLTDFVSLKKGKSANFLIAFPRLITLAAFWADFYSLPDCLPSTIMAHEEAARMLNLSILVSLENKSSTEEVITLTRYMYMEIFKANVSFSPPDPMKMLSKFPTQPRSRLTVWMMNRAMDAFHKMCVNTPRKVTEIGSNRDYVEEGEESAPGDKWEGLVNWMTGAPLDNATNAVNLMYLGYLKDKNEAGESNADWQLVEKIISEEMKLKPSKWESYKGNKSGLSVSKGKEFRLGCILHGVSILRKRLKSTLGTQWESVLEMEILNNLATSYSEDLATLKASSLCDHKTSDKQTSLKDESHLSRVKVIEAISARICKFGVNPFLKYKEFLEMVETTSKGVMCDLFKKAQHGGLREIYVLTIESRVLQLFIEVVSRTICSYFEEETLTHPKNKLTILNAHKVRSSRIARSRSCVSADFCSSSDKTRWNQNLTMPLLSSVLYGLAPSIFHPSLTRTMNLWASKLIRLPPSVIGLLHRRVMLQSPAYKELLHQFHTGRSQLQGQVFVSKSRSPYIRLTTGMMQGILHYTSSLLHICFLASSRYWILDTLKTIYGAKGLRFTMSSVCSSDDSATILSLFSGKNFDNFSVGDLKAFYFCNRLLTSMTYFCEFFGMVESAKSTTAMHDYVEFNSEFIFGNTLATPHIKYVSACLNITESESFIRRFHEQYNLISGLTSSGFSFLGAHHCQIAQAFLHYHTMGMSVSSIFPHYTAQLLETPDPVHGFFLLDSSLCVGLMGFSYTHWLACTNDNSMLANVGIHSRGETTTSPDGCVVGSLDIKFGGNYRWHKLLDRVYYESINPRKNVVVREKTLQKEKVDMELLRSELESVEKDPELLFRKATNSKELKVKLMLKSLSGGVAGSLSKGNPTFNAYSSSVYALFSHCFTRTTSRQDAALGRNEAGRTKRVEKVSLLSSLRDTRARYKTLKVDDLELALSGSFFLHPRYREVRDIVRDLRGLVPTRARVPKQKKLVFKFFPGTSSLPHSLLRTAGHVWFQHGFPGSRITMNRCIDEYKERFPWLRHNPADSLSASPFSTYVDLVQFMSGVSERERTVVRYGPPVGMGSLSVQLTNLMKRCYKRGYVLTDTSPGVAPPRSLGVLETQLSLALMIPSKEGRESQVMRVLESAPDIDSHPRDLINLDRWSFVISAIASKVKQSHSNEEMLSMITERGQGFRAAFTKAQERVETPKGEVQWRGPGEVLFTVGRLRVRLQLHDRLITRITVNSLHLLRADPSVLSEMAERLSSEFRSTTKYVPGVSAKYNNGRLHAKENAGTPVVVDSTTPAVTYQPDALECKIYKGSIVMTSLCAGRWVTVLSYKASPSRVARCYLGKSGLHPLPPTESPENKWAYWVEQLPAPAMIMARAVAKSDSEEWVPPTGFVARAVKVKMEEEFRLQAQLERQWLTTSLTKRLRFRGLCYSDSVFAGSTVATSVTADEEGGSGEGSDDDLDWLEEELTQMVTTEDENTKNFMSRVLKQEPSMPPGDEDDLSSSRSEAEEYSPLPSPQPGPSRISWARETAEYSDSDDDPSDTPAINDDFLVPVDPEQLDEGMLAVLDGLQGIYAPEQQTLLADADDLFMQVHPWWDNLIDDCLELSPLFFSDAFAGKVSPADKDFSKLLISFLGFEVKTEAETITSRFLRDL